MWRIFTGGWPTLSSCFGSPSYRGYRHANPRLGSGRALWRLGHRLLGGARRLQQLEWEELGSEHAEVSA